MGGTTENKEKLAQLRERAEKNIREKIVKLPKLPVETTSRLVQELRVHQIELEMQNEELRRAQKELEDSRSKYFSLFDLAPVGYFTLNQKNLIEEVNLTAAEMLGIERNRLEQQRFTQYIAPDYQDVFYLHRKRVFDTNSRQMCELRFIKKDGNQFDAQLITVSSVAPDGSLSYLQMAVTDISDRIKKVEDEVKAANDLYQSLVENIGMGIVLLDADYRIIMVNTTMSGWINKTPREIIGRECFKVFEKRPAVCEHCPGRLAMADGKPHFADTEGIGENGSRFSVQTHAFPMFDAEHRPKGFIEVVQDITERKQAQEALRKNEEKYRLLFENMAQGAFFEYADGTLTDCNQAAMKILGVTREQFMSRTSSNPHWKVIREDGSVFPIEGYPARIALKTGQPVRGVVDGVYNPRTNDYVWLIVNAIPMFKPGEKMPYQAFVTIHDITERKRAEEALRESEEQFRTLAALSPAAIAILRSDKEKGERFLYVNAAWEKMSGYSKDDTATLEPNKLIHPDMRTQVVERVAARMRGEAVLSRYETKIITKSGEVRWLDFAAQVIRYQGAPAIMTIGFDVTERKQAEQEIERYNKLLHETGEMAKVGGWEFDVGTLKQTWTEEIYRIHEVDMDYQPTVEKGIKFYAPQAIPVISGAVQKTIENGEPFDLELPFITAKGNHRWVHTIGKAYRQDGKTVKVGGTFQDITEQKKTEQRIQDYQKRLKSLTSRLSITIEREKQKIASGLHDNVCQKLALSKVNLQFLVKSLSDVGASNSLTNVCTEIDGIIEDIHSLTFELRDPVLHEFGLMAAVEKYLVEEIQEKYGIRFELKSDLKGKELTETIRGCLYRNIRELLVNVVKHARANQIKVSIHKSTEAIYVCVEDDGAGFDTGRIASLPTRTGGFGLFSIREQLEYLGGSMQVESKAGQGTKVTMTIPLKTEFLNIV